ncbi:MAG: DNA primase [Fibrobacterota bacterium]|nr:DNA primase [Fibrobacterota bacterium]
MALTKNSINFRSKAGGIGLPTQDADVYSVQKASLRDIPHFHALRDECKDGYYSPPTLSEPFLTSTLRDIILQVKENADIVQIIGQYVPLKKAGARYLGLCPFHHDRSPSMNVTPQMGIYKCFACGAGGDVLKFVQEYEKLDFIDALKTVAARAGVNIPENILFTKDDEDKGRASQALAANQLACQFYQEELAANPDILAYVAKRGINEETRKHFQMGLAPLSPEKLLKRAAAKGLPNQAFIDAGIMGEAAGGRLYDRFSGRLIFPIWNMSGHVIGFGGRILTPEGAPKDSHQPKYVNSPESAFYHKSKVLYGLNFARNGMDKIGEAVIVEGYMDLLALWQAGIRNAVAVSGTALTKDHVQILSRFAKKIFMFLDGDEPGRKAVRRSLEPLLAQGLEVKIPVLPSSEDPDSFARKHGGEKVMELFAQSEDIVAFLLRSAAKPVDAMSPEEKEGLLNDCLALLQLMPSPNVRDQYLDELRKKLALKSIRVQVARPTAYPGSATSVPLSKASDAGVEKADMVAVFSGAIPGGRPRDEALAEWQLLQLLISSPATSVAALDIVKLEWLQVETVRDLVDHLLAFVEETGSFAIKDFLERLSKDQQDALGGMRMLDGMDAEQERKHFSKILFALELRQLQKLQKQFAQEKNPARYAEMIDIQKRIRELQSKSKGGPI